MNLLRLYNAAEGISGKYVYTYGVTAATDAWCHGITPHRSIVGSATDCTQALFPSARDTAKSMVNYYSKADCICDKNVALSTVAAGVTVLVFAPILIVVNRIF
jgi:hypothetical protein